MAAGGLLRRIHGKEWSVWRIHNNDATARGSATSTAQSASSDDTASSNPLPEKLPLHSRFVLGAAKRALRSSILNQKEYVLDQRSRAN
uniref:Uncharacterized protein n=1 Tax=Leersia perrieri TaxID=77586 RepID=A0A0D9XDX5_9ORYZ